MKKWLLCSFAVFFLGISTTAQAGESLSLPPLDDRFADPQGWEGLNGMGNGRDPLEESSKEFFNFNLERKIAPPEEGLLPMRPPENKKIPESRGSIPKDKKNLQWQWE